MNPNMDIAQSTHLPEDGGPVRMDPEIKEKWLSALRSGDLNQGRRRLHTASTNPDGTQRHDFCCLGVLCELAVEAGIVERVDVSDAEGFEHSDEEMIFAYAPTEGENAGTPYAHYPPPAVARWAELPFNDTNPYVREYYPTPDGSKSYVGRAVIANLNDEGRTFEEIAEHIEDQF